MPQSAELDQILRQKPARLPADNMKGYAAFIEPSEFDWSEAKLSCHGRDSRAGIGVVARYEHGLPLARYGWIRSKLIGRQMIKSLYDARSDKCFGDHLGRQYAS